jgi:hypothetical protein
MSRVGALGLAGFVLVAVPAYALGTGDLAALTKLERGRWLVKDAEGAERQSVCIGDPMLLVQLEHGAGRCTREVVANDATIGTVQYSCPGRGFGHTTVRVETPRLAKIDTQGIVDGQPFGYRAEARRLGGC